MDRRLAVGFILVPLAGLSASADSAHPQKVFCSIGEFVRAPTGQVSNTINTNFWIQYPQDNAPDYDGTLWANRVLTANPDYYVRVETYPDTFLKRARKSRRLKRSTGVGQIIDIAVIRKDQPKDEVTAWTWTESDSAADSWATLEASLQSSGKNSSILVDIDCNIVN